MSVGENWAFYKTVYTCVEARSQCRVFCICYTPYFLGQGITEPMAHELARQAVL